MYFPPYSLDWAHIKSNARLARVYSRGLCEIFQFGRAFSPFRQDCGPLFLAARLINKAQHTQKVDNLMP
jgi:hypothetical protein